MSSLPPVHVIRTDKAAEADQIVQGEPSLLISTTSTYNWIYDDKGTGCTMDVSLYRPVPSDPTYSIIGDYAQGNYYSTTGKSFTVKAINDDPNFPLLKPPVDYSEIWSDKGSGGNNDGAIWFPVPPDGYISIGFVGQTGYSKPSIPSYGCLRQDLCADSQPGQLIWNDRGSGATKHVALYQFVGVNGAFVAQENYNPYIGQCHKLAGI